MEDALAELGEAVRLDPSSADAHFNLANLLASAGRRDEAIARYFEAVKLRPSDAAARSNLGALLALQGRYDEAIAQLEEAVRIDPRAETRANLERARELKKSGRDPGGVRP
jgi:Tfp pilus assembly protein PilF